MCGARIKGTCKSATQEHRTSNKNSVPSTRIRYDPEVHCCEEEYGIYCPGERVYLIYKEENTKDSRGEDPAGNRGRVSRGTRRPRVSRNRGQGSWDKYYCGIRHEVLVRHRKLISVRLGSLPVALFCDSLCTYRQRCNLPLGVSWCNLIYSRQATLVTVVLLLHY